MENKATDMAQPIFSLIPTEQQAKWDYVMGQMLSFVDDTNADIDMAYDFVCEQLGISPLLITTLHGILSTTLGKQQTIVTKPNTTSPDN